MSAKTIVSVPDSESGDSPYKTCHTSKLFAPGQYFGFDFFFLTFILSDLLGHLVSSMTFALHRVFGDAAEFRGVSSPSV